MRRDGTGCGNFQKSTSRDASHDFPLSFVVRWDRSVAHLRGPRRRFANQGFHGRSVQPECPRARRQSRIHGFSPNGSPNPRRPLALGPWKHALTGSREISAIFKRSSMTQVTGRRLRVTKQPIDTNRLAGQTGVFAEFRGQRSLQHRLPGRADALCSLNLCIFTSGARGEAANPPVGLFFKGGSLNERSFQAQRCTINSSRGSCSRGEISQ